jgi:hypothetical protein
MPENPYEPPRAPLEPSQAANAREMTAARKYLAGAMGIGLLEVIDTSTLAANGGMVGAFSYMVSIVEVGWLMASIVLLFRVKHHPTRLLAHAFLAYMVFGVIIGVSIDPEQAAPMPLIFAGGAFGLIYAVAAAYVRAWKTTAA